MKLGDIIAPNSVAVATDVNSKKRALEELASLLAAQATDVSARDIFTALVNREKLGSTGLGSGVGIPHGRISGVETPIAAVLKLPTAIDFESVDRQGVDLLFGLVVPKEATSAHLQILAGIAELCQSEDEVQAMRDCQNAADLYARVSGTQLDED